MNLEKDAVHKTNMLYEKEVQNYLSKNLDLLGDPQLTLVQTEHGVQFGTDVGRIDILATDSNGVYVVIEVKRGTAGRGAISQIQSYMGAIQVASPERKVRGILVAMGIDDSANAAMSMTQSIDYFEFQTRFDFRPVTKKRAQAETLLPVREKYWEKLGGIILSEAMICKKCNQKTGVVLVGAQLVCGLCGSSKV